ncbi:MurR/RpiR family transcriptional regulator, partial [Lacticaseibacillus paracasei]|uniref:MurR/RpiR family transcriptional regulator n=1 Tax=Lacticaseibacillus paracasei TaxID=1597 RepID=UPI001EE080A4
MAETILTTIHDQIDRMSAALQKLGQYILTHVHDVPKMNVSVLAEKSEVSQATVVRFAKALGYGGFTEFRLQLASENVVVNDEDANLFTEISPHDTAEELKVKLSSRVENAITTTSRRLPAKTLDSAANLLSWANVMSVFGIGASSVVANDFYQKF